MWIVEQILFSAVFYQEIADYGRVLIQSSDGCQEHIFIAGYGPLQRSHQGDHQEIAGYGAGYGPLQRSHRKDHHEIAGNS